MNINKLMLLRLSCGVAVLLATGLLAGCTKNEPTPEPTPAPAAGAPGAAPTTPPPVNGGGVGVS